MSYILIILKKFPNRKIKFIFDIPGIAEIHATVQFTLYLEHKFL